MNPILIAGIGNIFHGDDAFGVEVAQRLAAGGLPPGVQAVDFGIRSYDLAYAIADGCAAVVFVDAVSRGEKPGTLCLLELDPENLDAAAGAINGHSLNPVAVLQMVRAFGARLGRLYLVGCEAAVLERDDGEIRLSGPVAAAVPAAVELIGSLVNRLLEADAETWANEQPGLAKAAMERS
jgi:hydrogenase maturation protease